MDFVRKANGNIKLCCLVLVTLPRKKAERIQMVSVLTMVKCIHNHLTNKTDSVSQYNLHLLHLCKECIYLQ